MANHTRRSSEELALDVTEKQIADWAGVEVRAVAFAPGFFVTADGRLIRASMFRGIRFVQPWHGKRRNGKTTKKFVIVVAGCPQRSVRTSRLVCLAFRGAPPDAAHNNACHRDDDPANDRVDNLYWGTSKDNIEDCLRNEGRSRGLTNARARRAIAMSRDGMTVQSIAQHFGVADLTVRNLLSGRTWLHIEGERVLTKAERPKCVSVALAQLGFSSTDISILTGIKIKSVHEMVSRARRLGHLPRRLAA